MNRNKMAERIASQYSSEEMISRLIYSMSPQINLEDADRMLRLYARTTSPRLLEFMKGPPFQKFLRNQIESAQMNGFRESLRAARSLPFSDLSSGFTASSHIIVGYGSSPRKHATFQVKVPSLSSRFTGTLIITLKYDLVCTGFQNCLTNPRRIAADLQQNTMVAANHVASDSITGAGQLTVGIEPLSSVKNKIKIF